MITQIIDVTSHKSPIDVCPTELVQRIETFINDWDAICYVPEYAFDEVEPDANGFYEVAGFSHNDLLNLCYGNRELCDWLFHDQLAWAFPETYMDELKEGNLAYFYSFVVPSAKVRYKGLNGPCGIYTVLSTPFTFDKNGEPEDPDSFSLESTIVIVNGDREVIATPPDITPVYE